MRGRTSDEEDKEDDAAGPHVGDCTVVSEVGGNFGGDVRRRAALEAERDALPAARHDGCEAKVGELDASRGSAHSDMGVGAGER